MTRKPLRGHKAKAGGTVAIKRSIREMKQGKLIPWSKVKKNLRKKDEVKL